MALSNVAPTIFDSNTIFQTLAAQGLSEFGVSANSRGLRSVINPVGLSQLMADPVERSGFSADTPAVFFHPNRISIDNILLLSELNFGYEAGGFGEPDADATATLNNLRENAAIDSLPFIRNLAEGALTAAYSNLSTAAAITIQVIDEVEQDDVTIRGTDFTLAPSENQAFGDTYDSVASNSTLNSQFYTRLGLEQAGSITLDELTSYAATGSPTHYAISLSRSEGDNAAGQLLDASDTETTDTLVLTAAEMADYSYSAPENVGWDFINIIELEDSNNDGTYEGRGNYNSIALIAGEETEDAYYSSEYEVANAPEQTAKYTFYSEAGTSTEEFTLVFSGVSSNGYTDAFDAIDNGQFQVRVNETFEDGSVNSAIVDMYDSELDEMKIDFAYAQAETGMQSTGISVELHVLDTDFDLSDVEVYARFA